MAIHSSFKWEITMRAIIATLGTFNRLAAEVGLVCASGSGTERFLLWTPECLPILLPNLQRSKYIYRKIGGELSLGFIPRYLFM